MKSNARSGTARRVLETPLGYLRARNGLFIPVEDLSKIHIWGNAKGKYGLVKRPGGWLVTRVGKVIR
jgi:hypothetical protein